MNVLTKKVGRNKAIVTVGEVSRLVDVSDVPPDEISQERLLAKFDMAAPKPMTILAEPHVKSRRAKMIEIGEQSVASRDRIFKHLPHVPASRKNQAYDGLLALLMRGRITQEHKIRVRHLKTGEYEEITVGQMLDELGDMYLLQLKLRDRDQGYRDQVNAIFKDPQMSDEDKANAIEGIELPEFLDVDEESTNQTLVSRRADGKANGGT